MGDILSRYNNDPSYEEDDAVSDSDDDEPEVQEFLEKPANQHNDAEANYCFDSATTTDATSMTISLKLEQVMLIEKNLDLYEKVSIMYLLFDDPSSALDQLKRLVNGSNEKLLYNWAINQNPENNKWPSKLIEALCIIQNYQVLRGLGFNKQELVTIFMPHHSFTSLHVNKVRKTLYFTCEELDSEGVTTLLNIINTDFKNKGLSFEVYDSQYLELYFLYWETMGYIKQDDLGAVVKVLKQMDQLDLSDKLKELTKATEASTSRVLQKTKSVDGPKSNNIYEGLLNPKLSLKELASHISIDNASFVRSSNTYDIDPEKPGVCLIINQEYFYTEKDPKLQHLLPPKDTKLETRIGTEFDKEELETTFRQFGFKTIVENNLIHSDILKKIEEVMKTITEESSFFVCILSHGDKGVIYGVDSCRVSVESLKKLMVSRNRTNLIGKPKVLILQSCQGTRCQKISSVDEDDDITTDSPSPISETVPSYADFFTFWATVSGFGAIRHKKEGSWFIQSLCEKMRTLGNKDHFLDICTYVISDVSGKKWRQPKGDVAMVPQQDSTLRKLLYLPPIKSAI